MKLTQWGIDSRGYWVMSNGDRCYFEEERDRFFAEQLGPPANQTADLDMRVAWLERQVQELKEQIDAKA